LAEYIDKNHSKNISKKEFKKAFKIVDTAENGVKDIVIQKVCSVLYENRLGLQRAFRLMDSDGSGTLDVEEFEAGLQALNTALGEPLSSKQIRELFHVIDKEGKGFIEYEQFLSQFELVDTMEKKDKNRALKRSAAFVFLKPESSKHHNHKSKKVSPKEDSNQNSHQFELIHLTIPTFCNYCNGNF
jgi:Ca2+-binding EF-hand superfamily protein